MIPLPAESSRRIVPLVTVAILAACLLIYGWQISLGPTGLRRAILSFGMIPARLFGHASLPAQLEFVPPAATIFTSMFLHGGALHLAGNLLFLWLFGDGVEAAFGHLRFVVFFFVCGALAALAQALPDASSPSPMIGASGAISALVAAHLICYPGARFTIGPLPRFLGPPRQIPALLVCALWLLLLLAGALWANGDGVRAHLGGFAAGLVLTPLFRRRRR